MNIFKQLIAIKALPNYKDVLESWYGRNVYSAVDIEELFSIIRFYGRVLPAEKMAYGIYRSTNECVKDMDIDLEKLNINKNRLCAEAGSCKDCHVLLVEAIIKAKE